MTNLDKKFEKACKVALEMTNPLPQDTMLQFYAYYKIATKNGIMQLPSGLSPVRNGFKINALFQLSKLTSDEAKYAYIKLVEKHSNQKI